MDLLTVSTVLGIVASIVGIVSSLEAVRRVYRTFRASTAIRDTVRDRRRDLVERSWVIVLAVLAVVGILLGFRLLQGQTSYYVASAVVQVVLEQELEAPGNSDIQP